MVQSGTTIKAKIDKKIFSKPPGSTITIYKKSVTSSDGAYGGFSGTTKVYATVGVEVIGVPYGVLSKDRNYMKMGLNSEGQSKLAVPSETDVSQGDLVTLIPTGTYGEVEVVNEYPFNDINIAKIILLKEYLGDFTPA